MVFQVEEIDKDIKYNNRRFKGGEQQLGGEGGRKRNKGGRQGLDYESYYNCLVEEFGLYFVDNKKFLEDFDQVFRLEGLL